MPGAPEEPPPEADDSDTLLKVTVPLPPPTSLTFSPSAQALQLLRAALPPRVAEVAG